MNRVYTRKISFFRSLFSRCGIANICNKMGAGAKQTAEKLDRDGLCNKGTASAGPQTADNKVWAFSPCGMFSALLPQNKTFFLSL